MSIKNGSKVSIHYTLTVDGAVVDSSDGKEPLTFTQGEGQIIPGLEKELLELKKGDKKTVTVAPKEGYGEKNPTAIQKVPSASFDDAKKLKVGDVVNGQAGDRPFMAVVVATTDKEITIDMNHPLAGKTLNFQIEVTEIQ